MTMIKMSIARLAVVAIVAANSMLLIYGACTDNATSDSKTNDGSYDCGCEYYAYATDDKMQNLADNATCKDCPESYGGCETIPDDNYPEVWEQRNWADERHTYESCDSWKKDDATKHAPAAKYQYVASGCSE